MIVMGAGTNHWFHSDLIYRAMLEARAALRLPGRQRRRLGALRRPGEGPSHHRLVDRRVRRSTGAARPATRRPPRSGSWPPTSGATSARGRRARLAARAAGRFDDMHFADCYAHAARLGWLPSYPSFDRNPLDLTTQAAAEGVPAAGVRRCGSCRRGRLRFAAEDPDAPENFPRVLTLWRSNLLGSSSKGHEYFLNHLLGVDDAAIRNEETPPGAAPARRRLARRGADGQARPVHDDRLPDERLCLLLGRRPPRGHLVREARHLHHGPAPVRAPVQPGDRRRRGRRARDWDIFVRSPSRSRAWPRATWACARDLVAAPLLHDTPDELAQPPAGARLEARASASRSPARPCRSSSWSSATTARARQDGGARPPGRGARGPGEGRRLEAGRRGRGAPPPTRRRRGGPADGRPRLERAVQACETILALSSGPRTAASPSRASAARGADRPAAGRPRAETTSTERITYEDIQVQPRKVIASPEWSGME